MSQNKSSLHEIASGPDAIKTARSEPLPQEQPKNSMDFIRSLVLDIPVQTEKNSSVNESLNIEQILEAQLEKEANKEDDQKDTVKFDIPLLMRIFELVREDVKSDVELHNLVDRILSLKNKEVLTMQDYEVIAGDSAKEKENSAGSFAGDLQYEHIDALKKLAGIKQ